jgi:hypothetical protein
MIARSLTPLNSSETTANVGQRAARTRAREYEMSMETAPLGITPDQLAELRDNLLKG